MESLRSAHVVVVGQGYVGLPVSFAAVEAGYRVSGIDTDEDRVRLVKSGQSPVEDLDSARLEAALRAGKYEISSSYSLAEGFDFAIITVPTPLRDGSPDLSFIRCAAESIAPYLTRASTVILESTTYPGTTEELLVPILENLSGMKAGNDFAVGYSPERIDPGNQEWNLLNTPKVVSGISEGSLETVKHFYESLGVRTVPVSGTREAEMVKLLENTFRHVNIALVNELAKFSRLLDVNIWEAIEAASSKPFGFMKFTPGPGVGGHCLPIDPTYLSWAIKAKSGSDFSFVSLANQVNESMPVFVADRAEEILSEVNQPISGAAVLIIGLAYKSNTADTRESPAIAVARLLLERGANVRAVDNRVPDSSWPSGILRAREEDHQSYNLGVLITPHSGDDQHWAFARSEQVLDTRNYVEGNNVVQL